MLGDSVLARRDRRVHERWKAGLGMTFVLACHTTCSRNWSSLIFPFSGKHPLCSHPLHRSRALPPNQSCQPGLDLEDPSPTHRSCWQEQSVFLHRQPLLRGRRALYPVQQGISRRPLHHACLHALLRPCPALGRALREPPATAERDAAR